MRSLLPVYLLILMILFTRPSICLAQFGALDPGFIPVNTDLSVTCTAVQADGKVIIAGNFSTAGGVTRNRLARLNTNGSLDTGFDPQGGPSSQAVDLLIQPDGKILVAGNFGLFNGFIIRQVARVNTDGSRDTTFKTGTGANLPVNSLALQPDGKILLGGNFTNFNGSACSGIIRLLANGKVDTSFKTGSGISGYAEDIALYPDGRMMVVGAFTSYKSSARKNMVRIMPNGDVDPTFDPGTGPNAVVTTCLIQTDGKVFMSGNFTSVSGTTMTRLGRLNADGSVDPGFNSGTGVPNAPYESLLLPNGKIMISGSFAFVNSLAIHNIACLQPDGSVDMEFNTGGYGALAAATDVDMASDGKII
ncbi:MAG TPA: delta-60 repeat domain-containing protein, partial [Catalimonadaceae bacterium]|nr:delta-60 repeat domain-containing protein [Catalimonadaceae bacterium]